MAKVTLLFGNDPQGEFGLSKDEYKIGRSRDCEIVVDNLGVSRHHCSIAKDGDDWKIVDQGSNNGTFLNGQKVNVQVLKDKDRIVLGKFSLIFDAHGTAAEAGSGAGSAASGGAMGGEMTMFVDPEAIKKMQKDMADGTAAKRMALAVRSGGRDINCPLVKSDTTLGKSIDADVPVKGFLVKPIQAKIIKTDTGHRLLSYGGWRKVKVNGSNVHEATLAEGDIITIASSTLVYRAV